MLTLLSRLERYAAAFSPSRTIVTPAQAPPSSAAAMHSSQTNSSRTGCIPACYCKADVRNLDLQHTGRDHVVRSSSIIVSPTQVHSKSWIDGTPPPPKIFPGVVHERIRRGSLRQGSISEKDANATSVNVTSAPKSLPLEQEENGL